MAIMVSRTDVVGNVKVVELFGDLTKEYEAGILLGKVSSTYDSEGTIEHFDIPMGWVAPEQAAMLEQKSSIAPSPTATRSCRRRRRRW